MSDNRGSARQVAIFAKALSQSALEGFCDELDTLAPDSGAEALNNIGKTLQSVTARKAYLDLVSSMTSGDSGINARTLSFALRAIVAATVGDRKAEDVELVWTGPAVTMSTLRRTEQALVDLINSARETLLIVSFAVYKTPLVMDSLREALARGVSVRIIVETVEDSGGKLRYDGIEEIKKSKLDGLELYVWPDSQRRKSAAGAAGLLHAKCAVADATSSLVSSANLTGAALNLNIELGVALNRAAVAGAIIGRFDSLISLGVLIRKRLNN